MHKITEATLADLENHFLFWPDLKKKNYIWNSLFTTSRYSDLNKNVEKRNYSNSC